MTLGNRIAGCRKGLGLTQEALAQRLEVTNQAVSKWEADLCCPDVMLLPKLADIFDISLDALFGRQHTQAPALPWEDDGVLRAVLYVGRQLVDGHPAAREVTFRYQGPALKVVSAFGVTCDAVAGDVDAQGSVTCDDVTGNVRAAGSVTCDDVSGDIHAGGNVTCDCIDGNANAGGNITCDELCGTASAGGSIFCEHWKEPL